jgi:hypothetical protein
MDAMKYYNLNNSIVISCDGVIHTISSEDYRYSRIREALSRQDFDGVKTAIDPTKNLNKDGFLVKDGLVYFKDEPIPSILGNQFLIYKESSWVFKSLLNFWFNLKNRVDSETASQMINALVSYGAYPITEDGFYIVYTHGATDQTNSILNKKNQENGAINFYNLASVPAEYLHYFAEKKSLDDILLDVFGFNAKKLKKFAISTIFDPVKNFFNHSFFFLGEAFKDVLHPDNLYEVIEKNIFKLPHGDIISYKNFNTFIKAYAVEKNGTYSQKKIINLLNSAVNKPVDQLLIIGNIYVDLREKINFDIQNIQFTNDSQEIFEYLRKEQRNLKDPEVDLNIQNNFAEFWALNDVEVDDLRFLIPKTNYDLKEWSNIMQNCIQSYDKRVMQKSCVVFAIMHTKTNNMLYNVEISGKNISQFFTRGNRPPNPVDKKKICSFLKNKGLIFKE